MSSSGPHDHDVGPNSLASVIAAAQWTGVDPTPQQIDLLLEYGTWLGREAIVAGGIGPHEGHRIWERHIADSLLFGYGIGNRRACLDIGSGAGLPGIPLAVIHPQVHFDLVDKSGRRCGLLRRALGILKLPNCTVVHKDLVELNRTYPFVVSRAAMPAAELMIHVKHRLEPGGIANISASRAGSSSTTTAAIPPGLRVVAISVPDKILDTKVQLLRIEAIQNGS